jgi:hypothetical protein
MLDSQLGLALQMTLVMMCAATAFGILLANMLVRGRLHGPRGDSALNDLAFTEKSYAAVSIILSVAAFAAISFSWGSFALFVSVAIALQIAEHWMLPSMRRAAESGTDLPYVATRLRFEVLLATCLMVAFWKTAMPPLMTLARVYGLG